MRASQGPGHLQSVRRDQLPRTPKRWPPEGHALVTGLRGHGLLHDSGHFPGPKRQGGRGGGQAGQHFPGGAAPHPGAPANTALAPCFPPPGLTRLQLPLTIRLRSPLQHLQSRPPPDGDGNRLCPSQLSAENTQFSEKSAASKERLLLCQRPPGPNTHGVRRVLGLELPGARGPGPALPPAGRIRSAPAAVARPRRARRSARGCPTRPPSKQSP